MWEFVSGASMAMALVIAVAWWRYWRRSRDPLYRVFAAAFALLAVNYLVVAAATSGAEARPTAYLVRLLAFLLVIAAIVEANRRRRAAPEADSLSALMDDIGLEEDEVR